MDLQTFVAVLWSPIPLISSWVSSIWYSVVNSASGVISADASVDLATTVADLQTRLTAMELGPLFGLWFQSLFIGFTMQALSICIFLVIYGRMIEIYLVTSVGPIPMATMVNREWVYVGQNYSLPWPWHSRPFIMVCVGIYAVLVQNIATETDIIKAV